MKKALIIGGGAEYHHLFKSLGFQTESVQRLYSLDVDLVVFTGGHDVTPALYNEPKHPYTGNNPIRDAEETRIFTKALEQNIPMVGICRGGQFLNVMSGGKMYQHVSGHTQSHYITDVLTGEVVYVSSTHHQMMLPSSRALLVASSAIGGTREWFEGGVAKRDVSKEDIEVVFYEHTKALCFQPHPEFSGAAYEGMKVYFASLLERFFSTETV